MQFFKRRELENLQRKKYYIKVILSTSNCKVFLDMFKFMTYKNDYDILHYMWFISLDKFKRYV